MGRRLDRRGLLAFGSDAPQELLKVFGGFHLLTYRHEAATP
jgi:hypothetical protein